MPERRKTEVEEKEESRRSSSRCYCPVCPSLEAENREKRRSAAYHMSPSGFLLCYSFARLGIFTGQCCPNLPLLCVSCSATDGHLGGRWSWEQVGGGTIGAGRIRKCGMVGEEKEVKRSQQGQRTTHTPVPWRQGGVRGAETHLSPWGSRHWREGQTGRRRGGGTCPLTNMERCKLVAAQVVIV